MTAASIKAMISPGKTKEISTPAPKQRAPMPIRRRQRFWHIKNFLSVFFVAVYAKKHGTVKTVPCF